MSAEGPKSESGVMASGYVGIPQARSAASAPAYKKTAGPSDEKPAVLPNYWA